MTTPVSLFDLDAEANRHENHGKERVMQCLRYALTLAILAVAFTACQGSDMFSPEDVAQAAVATSEIRSMRMAIEMAITMPGSNENSKITGEGAFDNAAGRAAVMMDLAPLAGALRQNLGTTTTVIDGTQVYMKTPLLQQIAPNLKPWIKIDLQELSKKQGIDVDALLQLGRGGDPAETLAYLRAAGDVEEIEQEDVRGVPTTHYSAVVDLRKVPEFAPEESRERVRASIDQLIELTGDSSQPIDVWIDGEGLIRRMSFEQRADQGMSPTTTKTTVELYDFNSEVNIEVPPADQVSDLKELVSQPD